MCTQHLHKIALFVIFYLCGVFTAKVFHNPLSLSTEKTVASRPILQSNEPSAIYVSFADFISEAGSRLDAIIEEGE